MVVGVRVREDAPVGSSYTDLTGAQLLESVRALPIARPLLQRLAAAGDPPVHLVGGAVRDLLLGGEPHELDLVTEADPVLLAATLGGRAKAHARFGTGTVELDEHRYDIARARTETYARPGALPDVAPASIERDLPRRDFTVNALALTLTGPGAGELIGVPGARDDIANGVLRVLHDGSFRDDPTRLLRMARYAARLGFAPEAHTEALAAAARDGGALNAVSTQRVGHELRLLGREADPVAAFEALAACELDRALAPGVGLRDPASARSALRLLPADGRPDVVVLGAAFAAVEPPARRGLLDAFGFTAEDRVGIEAAAGAGALVAQLRAAVSPSQIAAAVAGAGPETVALAGALGAEEPAREWLQRLRHVRLGITGDDITGAGIAPGPGVGAGLRAALAATLDGTAATRSEQLAVALEAAHADG
jgi:tRNA nucleotidyltransferase (CCA-adding enzyme)